MFLNVEIRKELAIREDENEEVVIDLVISEERTIDPKNTAREKIQAAQKPKARTKKLEFAVEDSVF